MLHFGYYKHIIILYGLMEEEESFSEVCDSIKVMISLLWAIRLVIQMYDGLQYIASLLVVLGYYYCTNPVSKIISPPDWYIASTSGKPLYKVIFNFFDKHCMPQYCAIIHVNEATNGAPGRLYILYGHRAWPLPQFGALENRRRISFQSNCFHSMINIEVAPFPVRMIPPGYLAHTGISQMGNILGTRRKLWLV
jgi:hypothetical protein